MNICNPSLAMAAALVAILPCHLKAGSGTPHTLTSVKQEEASWVEDESWYRLAGVYQYLQWDFLGSVDAVMYSLELENQFSFKNFNVENRIIIDYGDYPAEIDPLLGNPFPVSAAGSGFGDLLVGTFVSTKNQGSHFHWGIGPVLQAPTASDEHMGSGKWTLGPGVHLQWHKDKLSAGLFLWNSWSIAGESDRKNVNQLTMKPYFIYNLTDKWNVLYIPLGISASWDKPSSQRWKIPLGGGVGRKFHVGEQEMEFQAQGFYSVERPDKAAEWSMRFTLEIPF